MPLKNQVMPFTCIKLHFEGEIFAPVLNGNDYQMESANFVLCGSKGNAYKFKSAQNAITWIDSNLIRASKNNLTRQVAIDRLILAYSQTPKTYLQTEIQVLEARNAGEWGIYFSDELLAEWALIGKGDAGINGLNGANGINGADGLQGLQGPQGLAGIAGNNGADGAQGLQGIKGDAGNNGADGLQGIKGDTGANGADGLQGLQGPQGLAGIAGNNGADGAQGLQGIKGDAGNNGADGLQGLQGVKGDTGANGADGLSGGGLVEGNSLIRDVGVIGMTVIPHGLGKVPVIIQTFVECLIPSNGYLVGDMILVLIVGVQCDSANIHFISNTNSISIRSKPSGASVQGISGSWQYRIRVWA